MESVKLNKRPFLTWQQLDWAEKIGISAERAYWLASCPSDTKCGNKDRPRTIHHLFNYETSFLYHPDKKGYYYFRIKRGSVKIQRKLSRDKAEALKMRDDIIAQMNLTLKK